MISSELENQTNNRLWHSWPTNTPKSHKLQQCYILLFSISTSTLSNMNTLIQLKTVETNSMFTRNSKQAFSKKRNCWAIQEQQKFYLQELIWKQSQCHPPSQSWAISQIDHMAIDILMKAHNQYYASKKFKVNSLTFKKKSKEADYAQVNSTTF